MRYGNGPRRRFVFRVEPAGLLAIRVGNPFAWFSFAAVLVATYLLLRWTALGYASLLLGAALGLLALGLVDRAIARGLATQTRDRLVRSAMNLYLPEESLRSGRLTELGYYTELRAEHAGRAVHILFSRPRPPGARHLLVPRLVPA
jgi:hypothetical protein